MFGVYNRIIFALAVAGPASEAFQTHRIELLPPGAAYRTVLTPEVFHAACTGEARDRRIVNIYMRKAGTTQATIPANVPFVKIHVAIARPATSAEIY